MLDFFFNYLRSLAIFINSDDCIGKIASKSIKLFSFYPKKDFNLIKHSIISSRKIRNSGNYIMIMLTRSSERILDPSRYTGYDCPKDKFHLSTHPQQNLLTTF